MYEMDDRFRAVITANTSEWRRWAELAASSGIPATSWQKACAGKQRPTMEMIQHVARCWPSYAFWLATGITDSRHGHVSCRDNNVGAFYPESDIPEMMLRSAARPYFDQAMLMFRRVYGTGLALPSQETRAEDQLRLLTLLVERIAEEESLSKAEHAMLVSRLSAVRAALHRSK